MAEIYKGRGNSAMRDDFIDFINYVFGFNGCREDFAKLLPKLYKEKYLPCEHNYVVTEDGKLKAAIGVFPRELNVMGTKLVSHGVGNVAVHPYSRSKGYMRELLNMAVKDMIASGADMSDLGGLRQRYGYFSYEVASVVCKIEITPTSLRHSFADVEMKPLEFVEVNESGELLDKIIALQGKRRSHVVRPAEDFLDIAHSWNHKLWAIVGGGRFIGYYIDRMSELTLCDMADFNDAVRNFAVKNGAVTLVLPLWETEMISAAWKICDDAKYANDQNYTIFHWAKVVGAFMKLRAASSKLIDGEESYLVHGIAGDEKFTVRVKDGVPEVTGDCGGKCVELEHKAAVGYFFGLVSPERLLGGVGAMWYPLPLFIESADHV